MEIEYGADVIDKNGKVVGTVDYVVRNTWTGEVSKFMVRQEKLGNELFFLVKDVLQVAGGKVKLCISLDELSEK